MSDLLCEIFSRVWIQRLQASGKTGVYDDSQIFSAFAEELSKQEAREMLSQSRLTFRKITVDYTSVAIIPRSAENTLKQKCFPKLFDLLNIGD